MYGFSYCIHVDGLEEDKDDSIGDYRRITPKVVTIQLCFEEIDRASVFRCGPYLRSFMGEALQSV